MTESERVSDRSTRAAAMAEGIERMISDPDIQQRLADRDRLRLRDERRKLLSATSAGRSLTAEDIQRVVDDELETTPALNIIKGWYEWVSRARAHGHTPVPRIVVMLGPRGLGKTVASAWLHAREGGLHVPLEAIARWHTARFGPDRKLFRRVCSAPFLTIDEPDIGLTIEEARPVLHAVVHARQHGPLTLFTGNLTPEAWRARLDGRTWERLLPIAVERYVKGESMRKPLRGGGLEDAAPRAVEGK